MNESLSGEIQRILQEQDFMPLPTGIDGTQLAVRTYEAQDVVCCDFLVYRELIGKDETLSDGVLLLLQSLTKFKTQLQSSPLHFSPRIQSQTISFLGKKTHILTDESGHLLKCQLYPLLISHSTNTSANLQESNTMFAPPIIQVTHLENYLTQFLVRRNPELHPLATTFRPLQRTYHYLGLTLILFPFLLGLSGILWGLGLVPFAFPILLVGLFGPAFLLRKASNAYHQFGLQYSIKVAIPKLPSPVFVSPEDIAIEAQRTDSSQTNLLSQLAIASTEKGESV